MNTIKGRPGPFSVPPRSAADIDQQLRSSWLFALASGGVWAFLLTLSDGYSTEQTLVYLTAICGITAGAITYGTAYAKIPIAFITPPLLSVFGYLAYQGGFDQRCLAFAVILYLGALVRSALLSEKAFAETSRLKNEATELAAFSADIADQMRYRAAHDPLTGLLNRAGFTQAVEICAATPRIEFCLMLLDLDGFKSINDAFGHSAGDEVLLEVARRLTLAVPDSVTIARLGGDEFAAFFGVTPTSEDPTVLADRLIATIATPFRKLGTGRIGVSIGIHCSDTPDLADMLICADEALYSAKAGGRNQYCKFDQALRLKLDVRLESERDLPRALQERALEIWYQPIFGSGGNVLCAFEALLRWKHPRHGWISPPDVISAAAIAGVSEGLLTFIVEDACKMLADLSELGFPDVRVALKLSPREMSQLPVDDIVMSHTSRFRLTNRNIEIEITEDPCLDIPAVREKISSLRSAGVRLVVDNFGVGYSSLASVRDLHPDAVRVDRCFVNGISKSPKDRAFVQAVLALGRSMSFEVVAEGIESEEDLCTLQNVACELFQGHHLGRPMPRNATLDWIAGRIAAAA